MPWYEYSVEWQADDDPYNSHTIAVPNSVRTATIGAVFHDEVPDSARLVHVTPDESARIELARWDTEMAEIQFTQRHVPPGSLTLEWRLPGADPDWP